PQQVEDRLKSEGEGILKDAKERLGDVLAESRLELGHPGELISETAEVEDFDLVVMGSRGLGRLQGYLMGSVSSYVLSHCAVPVLVIKLKEEPTQG
ncbi:MAG: universal stress protein, partial [Candidatus Eremiobacterota bacterium]